MAALPLASRDGRPLTERVRPDSLAQMVGNPEAVAELKKWAKAWQAPGQFPRLRAALLSGPPGVGKTTAAVALALDMGWGLVEMNASDARNRTAIEQVAGRAALTNAFGLDGKLLSARRGQRTLILLDEADCLFSRGTEASEVETRAPPSLREFLRTRYGNVDSLAVAWGLGGTGAPPKFTDWAEIPTSGGRSKAFRLPAAQRDLADWSQTKVRADLSDRGGLGAIAKLVRETRQPIILTVNDPKVLSRYSQIFRSGVARISFWPVRDGDLKSVVERVARSQDLQVSPTAAEAIVRRSHGDLRAALNDLDAISALPPGRGQEQLLGPRDVTSDFFDMTREILESPRVFRSVEIRNRLDATPDDLLPWIEENLPKATRDPATRLAAFEPLAEADLLLSRARRFRTFGLWSYASELMSGGVSIALAHGDGHAPDRIAFPQFLGEMGRARTARTLRMSILSKSGRMLHISRRKAVDTALPFLAVAFRPGPARGPPRKSSDLARRLVAALELNVEEVAYLTGGAPDDTRVKDLVESTGEVEEATPSAKSDAAPESVPTASQSTSNREGSSEPTAVPNKGQRRLAEY